MPVVSVARSSPSFSAPRPVYIAPRPVIVQRTVVVPRTVIVRQAPTPSLVVVPMMIHGSHSGGAYISQPSTPVLHSEESYATAALTGVLCIGFAVFVVLVARSLFRSM